MNQPVPTIQEKLEAVFELYDEMGSELPESEVNFLRLLVTKAQNEGLVTEKLTQDEIRTINMLIVKYSNVLSFDSDEISNKPGMG